MGNNDAAKSAARQPDADYGARMSSAAEHFQRAEECLAAVSGASYSAAELLVARSQAHSGLAKVAILLAQEARKAERRTGPAKS